MIAIFAFMLRSVVVFIILSWCNISFAQDSVYTAFLNREPYFAAHHAKITDSLFLKDVRILNYFLKFDSLDAELLKPPVLGAVLLEQARAGKPATFKTMIDYFQSFRQTLAYQDFRTGLVLYKKLENQPVDLNNWEQDKLFFVRLGFTESDLEDFKDFLQSRSSKNATYKQAYTAYMKEIEAL